MNPLQDKVKQLAEQNESLKSDLESKNTLLKKVCVYVSAIDETVPSFQIMHDLKGILKEHQISTINQF